LACGRTVKEAPPAGPLPAAAVPPAPRLDLAAEVSVPEAVLKTELGRVLLKLEALQDATISQALEPKAPPVPDMSEAEHDAALALLKTPDLLPRILPDFEACGIVGEATNKLVAYLAATSRKLERPLALVASRLRRITSMRLSARRQQHTRIVNDEWPVAGPILCGVMVAHRLRAITILCTSLVPS
jgi:hypothetical protein